MDFELISKLAGIMVPILFGTLGMFYRNFAAKMQRMEEAGTLRNNMIAANRAQIDRLTENIARLEKQLDGIQGKLDRILQSGSNLERFLRGKSEINGQ